jgi:outer membrane protein TolC
MYRIAWLFVMLFFAGCRTASDPDDRCILPLFGTFQPPCPLRFEQSSNVFLSCFSSEHIIDLEQALRLANVQNPTIELAKEIVRANLADQMQARSLLFPNLNVGSTLAVHRGSLLSSRGILEDVNRQSLYVGGGADVRGTGPVNVPGVQLVAHLPEAAFAPKIARQRVMSSRFDAVATRNNILLDVATTYLALVGAEARLLANLQSESEFAELAKITADFADTGQGRESDAERVTASLQLLRSAAQGTDEEMVMWATELARLLSLDPTVRLRPEPGMSPLIQLGDDRLPLEVLIAMALAHRPEIAARSLDVSVEETRLRQERVRPLLPTLVIGLSDGDFGGGSDKVPYRFSHFGGRADVDVLAVWTVQNLGMGHVALAHRARSEIGQAEALRMRIVDQVRREVAEALAQTKASRVQMEVAKKRVATSEQAYRQDFARAKNLKGLLIEAVNSLNLLASARQDLVSAMIDYSQAQFRLHVSLGDSPLP